MIFYGTAENFLWFIAPPLLGDIQEASKVDLHIGELHVNGELPVQPQPITKYIDM